jgi:hypothetical protein
MLVIYDHNMFIVQATDAYFSDKHVLAPEISADYDAESCGLCYKHIFNHQDHYGNCKSDAAFWSIALGA